MADHLDTQLAPWSVPALVGADDPRHPPALARAGVPGGRQDGAVQPVQHCIGCWPPHPRPAHYRSCDPGRRLGHHRERPRLVLHGVQARRCCMSCPEWMWFGTEATAPATVGAWRHDPQTCALTAAFDATSRPTILHYATACRTRLPSSWSALSSEEFWTRTPRRVGGVGAYEPVGIHNMG